MRLLSMTTTRPKMRPPAVTMRIARLVFLMAALLNEIHAQAPVEKIPLGEYIYIHTDTNIVGVHNVFSDK